MHFLLICLSILATAPHSPSFGDFDRRARDGERLNVVFFGASLTWGANATDPNKTSYRADVANRLEETYPQARFKFHDAAIGGTGSQLGVFRLDRDVLAHHPDLVFLDFSANDDIYSDNPQTLASYEAILRRLVLEAGCPVVQVIFPFKENVVRKSTDGMKRRDAHLALANAYNTAVGDAIALGIQRVSSGETTIERIWPIDGVHPSDDGYVLFADAAWAAFKDAVDRKIVCQAPEKMIYGNAYEHSVRMPLRTLTPLPAGWREGKPNVTAAYFDFQMSRWLDSEVIASLPVVKAGEPVPQPPLRFAARFRGSMLMLLGESTPKSGKYRVWIDGKTAKYQPSKNKEAIELFDPGQFAKRINGNGHHAQVIATDLDTAVEHTVEIEPILEPGQELRIESICVAGPQAVVVAAR